MRARTPANPTTAFILAVACLPAIAFGAVPADAAQSPEYPVPVGDAVASPPLLEVSASIAEATSPLYAGMSIHQVACALGDAPGSMGCWAEAVELTAAVTGCIITLFPPMKILRMIETAADIISTLSTDIAPEGDDVGDEIGNLDNEARAAWRRGVRAALSAFLCGDSFFAFIGLLDCLEEGGDSQVALQVRQTLNRLLITTSA